MEFSRVREACRAIIDEISETIVVEDDVLVMILTGLLADGHILMEDAPGTGKTLLARTLADVLGLSFSRIQLTPDLLPSDVTGTQVFDENSGDFEFQAGPVFSNVVLADEINRASPKTQSALLEAMAEGQVTVGEESYQLPDPCFIIATQNPVESEGTFELPEAQKDRFMIKTSLGYPSQDGEVELLNRRADRESERASTETLCTRSDIEALLAAPEQVHVESDVRRYIASLARETREDDRVATGVSPRGTQKLFEAARARAALSGRPYLAPDEVKAVAPSVLAHRIALRPEVRVEGVETRTIVEDAIRAVPVPTPGRPAR